MHRSSRRRWRVASRGHPKTDRGNYGFAGPYPETCFKRARGRSSTWMPGQRADTWALVARSVMSELDLESVFERVLDAARRLTGARYAALGILDDDRNALARFVTAGISDEARRHIGDLPRGRGVLGELIRN